MSELIKREDAIKATWKEPSYTDPLNVLTEVRDRINELPTIDAVKVVRCKDCINGKPLDNGDVYKCMMIGHNNPPCSFCWWGERRKG